MPPPLHSVIHSGTPVVDGCTLRGLSHHLPTLVTLARQGDTAHPALRRLRDTLLHPFLDSTEIRSRADDFVTMSVASPGSDDAEMAAAMLEWGYCSRYYTGRGVPRLPAEASDDRMRTHTLVAHAHVGGRAAVIATLQVVVGDTVPALSLFSIAPDSRLPRRDSGVRAQVGELRRFSVSPTLEVAPRRGDPLNAALREYRGQLYGALYDYSHRLFRSAGASVVYGVATPEIYRFFTRSGMPMVPLEGTALIPSDEVRTLQRDFALYWRPSESRDRQPALYQILLRH